MRRFIALGRLLIVLLALACVLPKFAQTPDRKQGTHSIQFWLSQYSPAAGSEERSYGGGKIYLLKKLTIGPSDIKSVAIEVMEYQPKKMEISNLKLVVSEGAAKEFESATVNNNGKAIAVIIDKKVVAAPNIMMPIRTTRFVFTLPSNANEQQSIYEAFQSWCGCGKGNA